MNNVNQFYPTPEAVVLQMVEPFVFEYNDRCFLRKGKVLEPSAGHGAILDVLVSKYKFNVKELYAVELDEASRFILSGKGYKVIDSDFLKWDNSNDFFSFDLILMNPPFKDGCKHLLHAWNLLINGDIVCLLNAETITNAYSKERQLLLEIIEANGSVEFLGEDVFPDVRVNTALVRLNKKTVEEDLFGNSSDFEKEGHMEYAEFESKELAQADVVEALVSRYNAAVETLKEMKQIEQKHFLYVDGITGMEKPSRKGLSKELEDLKFSFWNYLFKKTKVGEITTSKYQKKFFTFQQTQRDMAFTVDNIYRVLYLFLDNKSEMLTECLLDVFDTATRYHEKNREHIEGWKTNKAYRMNKKLILPYAVNYEQAWGNWRFNWSNSDFLSDIDKVCCFVSGQRYDAVQTKLTDAVQERCSQLNRNDNLIPYREPFESTFFTVKFFKKGTVHIEFKDEELCNQINILAARGRGWLGGGY